MAADVLVHPDDRRVALRSAEIERLKYERGNIQIADPAAVGDLLHLHVAVARRPPFRVGLRLVAKILLEVADAILGRRAIVFGSGLAAKRRRGDQNGRENTAEPRRSSNHPPNLTPEVEERRAGARMSASRSGGALPRPACGRRRASARSARPGCGRCRRASGPGRPRRPRSGTGGPRWIVRSDEGLCSRFVRASFGSDTDFTRYSAAIKRSDRRRRVHMRRTARSSKLAATKKFSVSRRPQEI